MNSVDLTIFHELDIILICGLPGAGKSFFSRQYFMDKVRRRINRKEIRRLLYEMTNFGEKWSEKDFSSVDEHLVKHTERKIIEHLLTCGEKVLIDNTSVSAVSRSRYIKIAKEKNKSIGIIFLDTDVNKCIERNRLLEDPIPERIIVKLSTMKELPIKTEGFNKILIIDEKQI